MTSAARVLRRRADPIVPAMTGPELSPILMSKGGSMTRLFDAHIIASGETLMPVRDRVRYRELGTPRLKGLRARTALYEILGRADALSAVASA